MSYSVFDAASFQDDSETKRAISKAVAPSSVNQEQAQRASAIVKRYPTSPSGPLDTTLEILFSLIVALSFWLYVSIIFGI